MIAINPSIKLTSQISKSPDIAIDSNLRRWFSRNLGLWKSQRTYFLKEKNKTYNVCMFLKIKSINSKKPWQSHYKFSWYPEKEFKFFDENPRYQKKGSMNAYIQGHQLIREKFYLCDKKGLSNIKQVDEHEMIFESSYQDWYILEHTRLLDMDNFRYRVIYSWNRNNIEIVETHHEERVSF